MGHTNPIDLIKILFKLFNETILTFKIKNYIVLIDHF